MQSLVTFFWVLLALICVLGAVLPFFIGEVVCMASMGAESRSIRESGLPLSYEELEFGEWQDGAGELAPSSLFELSGGAKILRHRTGRAVGTFSVFTFSEAEYEFEDGSKLVAHASGPVPLVIARKSVTVGAFAVFSFLTVLFVGLGYRSSKAMRQTIA